MLVPGVGVQGGRPEALARPRRGGTPGQLLPAVAREVLRAGPNVSDLRAAGERMLDAVAYLPLEGALNRVHFRRRLTVRPGAVAGRDPWLEARPLRSADLTGTASTAGATRATRDSEKAVTLTGARERIAATGVDRRPSATRAAGRGRRARHPPDQAVKPQLDGIIAAAAVTTVPRAAGAAWMTTA